MFVSLSVELNSFLIFRSVLLGDSKSAYHGQKEEDAYLKSDSCLKPVKQKLECVITFSHTHSKMRFLNASELLHCVVFIAVCFVILLTASPFPFTVKHNWETMRTAVNNYIGSLNWGYRVALRDKNVNYVNSYAEFIEPHKIKVNIHLCVFHQFF